MEEAVLVVEPALRSLLDSPDLRSKATGNINSDYTIFQSDFLQV